MKYIVCLLVTLSSYNAFAMFGSGSSIISGSTFSNRSNPISVFIPNPIPVSDRCGGIPECSQNNAPIKSAQDLIDEHKRELEATKERKGKKLTKLFEDFKAISNYTMDAAELFIRKTTNIIGIYAEYCSVAKKFFDVESKMAHKMIFAMVCYIANSDKDAENYLISIGFSHEELESLLEPKFADSGPFNSAFMMNEGPSSLTLRHILSRHMQF